MSTRERLIDATFNEIYSHGYQGASLSKILENANLHKGSMYHFFRSKKEMALAAIDEKVAEWIDMQYMPILNSDNAIIPQLFIDFRNTTMRDFDRGCPIANLAQEMSNLDADFKRILNNVYKHFIGLLHQILDKAMQNGEIKECDTDQLAHFIVIVLEGAILSAKISGEVDDYSNAVENLMQYLESYRINSPIND